jgi:hypothetical protein
MEDLVGVEHHGRAEVSLGSSSQCVHLATGVVRCFGSNTYGELGSWLAPLGTDQLTSVGVGGVFSPLQSDGGGEVLGAETATGSSATAR